MLSTAHPQDNRQDIRRQLDEAKEKFDALKMKPGESLRDFEYRVKRHSDQILSLKIAEKVQEQQDATSATTSNRTLVPPKKN